MTDYIPTTELVQARYHLATVSDNAPQFLIDAGRLVCNAEFKRWLRSMKAEIWREGYDSGFGDGGVNAWDPENPYL